MSTPPAVAADVFDPTKPAAAMALRKLAPVSQRPAADWLPEFRDGYVATYAKAIEDYGMGLDDIAAQFSTVLTPTHLTAR
jgi:hypothetical protein